MGKANHVCLRYAHCQKPSTHSLIILLSRKGNPKRMYLSYANKTIKSFSLRST